MKKAKSLFYLLILTFTFASIAQTHSDSTCKCESDTVNGFFDYEQIAVFPGGDLKLMKYLADSIRYPEEAREQELEDRVYVQFCIRSTGKITNIEVLKGEFEILNKEAVRVISTMPNWSPSISRGKPTCTSYRMPINFTYKKKRKDDC